MGVRVRWRLNEVLEQYREAAARGLEQAADHLLAASDKVVPVREGTLRRSGKVVVNKARLRATVSYSTRYAFIVHEDLDDQHDAGRTAKYLERPARTEAPAMTQIIAAELRHASR